MRGRPRCRPAVSVPEISVSGLEILSYQHFRPVNRMNVVAGCILAFRMASLRHRYNIAQARIHTGFHGFTEIGQTFHKKKKIFPENGLDNFSPSNFQALETIITFRRFVRLHPGRMELANMLSK